MTDIGNLFVVAAPSGAGKTTLVKALIESLDNITVSISHTTRLKRPQEENGSNYHFIDETIFKRMVDHHDFLEHAVIFGNHYGTSKQWVTETLAKGIDVILEIDWQGHQQIKKLFPSVLGVFILPPSLQDLKSRLETRNQDAPDVIKMRLADAQETITHASEFDYVVLNDDFDRALKDLQTVILAERLRQSRQLAKLSGLLKQLTTVS